MKTYKLFKDPATNQASDYAMELVDNMQTGVHVHIHLNAEYLKWLAEGNVPTPADEETQ